jgi:hypothetical protein
LSPKDYRTQWALVAVGHLGFGLAALGHYAIGLRWLTGAGVLVAAVSCIAGGRTFLRGDFAEQGCRPATVSATAGARSR